MFPGGARRSVGRVALALAFALGAAFAVAARMPTSSVRDGLARGATAVVIATAVAVLVARARRAARRAARDAELVAGVVDELASRRRLRGRDVVHAPVLPPASMRPTVALRAVGSGDPSRGGAARVVPPRAADPTPRSSTRRISGPR